MSKVNDKALAFLQKSTKTSVFSEGFEERELAHKITFKAEFVSTPLSKEESLRVQKMLESSLQDSQLTSHDIESDHKNLLDITTQIRAIERQSILLHGERICKAQQILKKYKDSTFSKWLYFAYGNRQTPYRMLQFYKLLTSLEKDEKNLVNSMPKRAAYALASRKGEIEKKVEIIKKYHTRPQDDIFQAIKEAFPLKANDRRSVSIRGDDIDLLNKIFRDIRKIKERKNLKKVLKLVENVLSTGKDY